MTPIQPKRSTMYPRSDFTFGRRAGALLSSVVALGVVATTAAPVTVRPTAVVPVAAAAVPETVSFAAKAANSGNWAGWVAAGHHTAVSASWRQPSVTCTAHETSDSAFWVGLDGYGSASVEQVGTQAGCSNGHAFYSAWTEFYPAPSVLMSNVLRPGDALRATVTFVSGHKYRLVMTNSTRKWARTVTGTASNGKNASVEVVAEAPTDARTHKVMRLSHFSATRFSAMTVDGSAFSQVAGRQQLVMGSRSRVMADPSGIDSSQSFGVSWRAAAG